MSETPSYHGSLALANQVQDNFIAYFRLFAGLPGIHYNDEEDVTWIVTEQGAPGNHLLRTRFASDSADRRIDEVMTQVGGLADQIDWFVFPGCEPDEIGQRLIARGRAGGPDDTWELIGNIGGPGGNWMLADLTTLVDAPATPVGFHIRQVRDEAMLEAWRAISAAGFGGDDLQIYYDAYARHGFGEDAIVVHYIGYMADQPVTSSTLLLAGGSASIYNVSTPEPLRRQGFGGAITHIAMQEAQRRGYRDTWIWSSAQGKGVYGKLGYNPVSFGIREYQWQRKRTQG